MLNELCSLNEVQDSHLLQASVSDLRFKQLIVFARIRAQVVFPTPRGPQNKNACAKWLFTMAFFSVLVIDCCPTTVSKVCGLYLRADTMKFPIDVSRSYKHFKYKRCFQISSFLKL